MAVRLKKAGVRVLLECNSSTFLQHCSPASRFPIVATPPTSVQSRPVVSRERGPGHTSSELTTGSRSSSIGARSGSKYIVNPCRYPPHLLHTRLSCAVTRCQPLSISRDLQPTRNIQDFHKLSLVPQQQSRFPDSRVPPLLSCVSLLCERATHLPLPLSPPPTSSPHDQVLTVLSPTWNVPHMLAAMCTFSSSSLLLSSSPDKPPGDDRPTAAQMAIVLLKLREEIPSFFDGHHSTDLYAADVVFENSLGPKSWTVQGCTAYSALLTIWRLGVRTCFTHTQLDLLKISKDVEQGKIEARWRARGRPRAPWRAKERIIVEAFSTFQVGADGNIAIHKVDKVMPGGKEPNRVMSWLARVGVALIPSPPHPSIGVTRTSHDILPHNA